MCREILSSKERWNGVRVRTVNKRLNTTFDNITMNREYFTIKNTSENVSPSVRPKDLFPEHVRKPRKTNKHSLQEQKETSKI